MRVAANIHDGRDNTIAPDGGKLIVGQAYDSNSSADCEDWTLILQPCLLGKAALLYRSDSNLQSFSRLGHSLSL